MSEIVFIDREGVEHRFPEGTSPRVVRQFLTGNIRKFADFPEDAKPEAVSRIIDDFVYKSQNIDPKMMRGDGPKPAVDIGLTPDEREARNKALNPSKSIGRRMRDASDQFIRPEEVPMGLLTNPIGAAADLIRTGKRPAIDPLIAPRAIGGAMAATIAGVSTLPEKMGLMSETDSKKLERDAHGLLAGMSGITPMATPAAAPSAARTAVRASDDFAKYKTAAPVGARSGNRAAIATQRILDRSPGRRMLARSRNRKLAGEVTDDILGYAKEDASAPAALDAGLKRFVDKGWRRAKELEDRLGVDENLQVTPMRTTAAFDDVAGAKGSLAGVVQKVKSQKALQLKDAFAEATANGPPTFGELKELRSVIGEYIKSGRPLEDMSIRDMRRVYGAISDDIRAALPADQAKKWDNVNRLYRTMFKRIDKSVGSLTKLDDPETAFARLDKIGMRSGKAFRGAFAQLPKSERRQYVSAKLADMGKITSDKEGVSFSVNKFFTNYENMPKGTKDILFGTKEYGAPMRADLDRISRVISRLRQFDEGLFNPSRSGIEGMDAAIIGGSASSMVAGAAMQDAAVLLAPLGVAAATNMAQGALRAGSKIAQLSGPATQKLMNTPQFVRWLANSSQRTVVGTPKNLAALEVLSRNFDMETKGIVDEYIETVRSALGQ